MSTEAPEHLNMTDSGPRLPAIEHLSMADTKPQLPTTINFLEFPYDIRCVIYSFVDLSFHGPQHQNWFSDDLIAYTSGATTGIPILDCSATIRAEAFPYVVKQNCSVLQETTPIPFTKPNCTAIVKYLERTRNLDVFYHTIDEAHFDLRQARDADALAVLAKCNAMEGVLLTMGIDEVDTSAPEIMPQALMNVLVKLPNMYCVFIHLLDSRDGGMRTLEELGSEAVVRKWEYLEHHGEKDLKALVKLADADADLSDGRIYWHNEEDGSFEFAESWTVDKSTRTWKVKCYLKPDEWIWAKA